MLNIGMLTGSVSRQGGGVFPALRGLTLALRDLGVNVQILGLEDSDTAADLPLWDGVPVHVERRLPPRAFGYGRGLYEAMESADLDLLHVSCLWMYPTLASLRWSRKTGRPVIVSPHGTLDRWALRNSRWKKLIAAAIYERRHLGGAAFLHALTESEAEAFRNFGLKNPVCVIPNGVDLPKLRTMREPGPWRDQIPHDAKVLLFLGRLHPKKNLISLIRAWAAVCQRTASADNWWLVIAGWDEVGHERQCSVAIQQCQAPRVYLPGPYFGAEKDCALRSSTAFVLPSLSEGLPIAVLEAWSYGLPVLLTPECNLAQGAACGAAIETGSPPRDLEVGLERLVAMDDVTLHRMGDAARALVGAQFSWPRIADQMRFIYEQLLHSPQQRTETTSETQWAP